jgi:hypothetical protein
MHAPDRVRVFRIERLLNRYANRNGASFPALHGLACCNERRGIPGVIDPAFTRIGCIWWPRPPGSAP